MSTQVPPTSPPETHPIPTEPPPTIGTACAHCDTTWGATATPEVCIHLHDRRVFARGTRLCVACTHGCGSVGR